MNELQVFNYNEKDIRTVKINNEPWFVLKDVCKILDLGSTSKVAARLDDDEKGVTQIQTLGGKQKIGVVNESGLYHVMLRSDKPEAKPFRKWVTSEVLPSIRKHGAYATEATLENMISNPDFAIKLFMNLKNEQDMRKALEIENAKQKHILLELQPKAEYADNVLSATNGINITQIAKEYGMGAVKFNKLLHDLGIQYQHNKCWVLYDKHADKGYVISQTHYYINERGERCAKIHNKWTQKGRQFVYEKLKAIGIIPVKEREAKKCNTLS